MTKHLHIELASQSVDSREVTCEDLVAAGRHLIAKSLLEAKVAGVDPLSPENLLIFSVGPLAGTTMSTASRICVGCKSPLTGGIKEANAGGTFAYALGQLALAGLTLYGSSSDWTVIHIRMDGSVAFDDARPYAGKGNYEAASLLRDVYGKNISIALCGPVGEYLGLLAGVAFTDREGRPGRLAARGGVGAVMGSKKVKAIVVDQTNKLPAMQDRAKFLEESRSYAQKSQKVPTTEGFQKYGTAGMADLLNYMGGLTIRNFSCGRLVERGVEPLKIGGEYIHDIQAGRNSAASHSCMTGCVVQCSHVHVDASGKELVTPLEYESLGLMGINCGLSDPDDIARLNYVANDLGVDSIETGATLGILMDAGFAEFGDLDFLTAALDDIRCGNERGRLLAQGTARVGEHYGIKRVPVIKKQAISAYDPRVVEITAISMMTSAMGGDHTAGNNPWMDIKGKSMEELVGISRAMQTSVALIDSLGFCFFSRLATDQSHQLIANAINAYHGTNIEPSFIESIGPATLRMERTFNRLAGFTPADDKLPAFFYEEPLPPTNKVFRHTGEEVSALMSKLLD